MITSGNKQTNNQSTEHMQNTWHITMKLEGHTIQHFLWEVLWDLFDVKTVVFIPATEKIVGQLAASYIIAAVNTWKIKNETTCNIVGSLVQAITNSLFGVKMIWLKEHRWSALMNSPREHRMPSGAVFTSSFSRAWTCRSLEQLQTHHCIRAISCKGQHYHEIIKFLPKVFIRCQYLVFKYSLEVSFKVNHFKIMIFHIQISATFIIVTSLTVNINHEHVRNKI